MREVDVAAVQNLERVEELSTKKRGAPRIPRQRCERPNRGADAAEAPEVRFEPPDADDDPGRDAVALPNLVENRAMEREHLARRADRFRGQPLRYVLLERQHRLGLAPVAFDNRRLRLLDA